MIVTPPERTHSRENFWDDRQSARRSSLPRVPCKRRLERVAAATEARARQTRCRPARTAPAAWRHGALYHPPQAHRPQGLDAVRAREPVSARQPRAAHRERGAARASLCAAARLSLPPPCSARCGAPGARPGPGPRAEPCAVPAAPLGDRGPRGRQDRPRTIPGPDPLRQPCVCRWGRRRVPCHVLTPAGLLCPGKRGGFWAAC